mgnify:CR=1 FL=1
MKNKRKNETLTPKQQELETAVQESMTEKVGQKNKNKLKGYKGIKQLVPYYLKYKGLCWGMVITFVFTAILNFFIPIFDAKALASIADGDFLSIIKFACISTGIFLVSSVVSWGFNRFYLTLDSKVGYDLRQGIMRSITNVKMSKIDKTNSGVFIDRSTDDTSKCSDILVAIFTVLVDLISSLCFFIYIAFLNIWLFLLLLVYVVVIYVCDDIRMKVMFESQKGNRKRRELAYGSYNEQIRGVRDIKSLNMKEEMLKDSGEKLSYVLKKNIQERFKFHDITFFLRGNLCELMELAVLVIGILLVKNNIVTLTTFLIVYMYRGRATNVTKHIGQIKQHAADGELAAQRYFEVVNEYPKEQFGDETLPEPIKGDISFKNVCFSYDGEKQVLKDISFDIEANKTTAIVGKSGCGKSTILSLINNLYEKNSGEITIDGMEVASLTEDSLRNTVGVVTQAPYIFNATIRNNLLFVRPEASENEMWNALKQAQIDDFIKSQEKGLDSMVGENGVMLSGGQKQRLAIARVLLKGSKIIAFDEATSALDNKSQGALVGELDKLKSQHTIVVVAHRLSTIVNADKIIVVDDGKKVAEGTHKQLMKTCKIYKDLYESEESASVVSEVD